MISPEQFNPDRDYPLLTAWWNDENPDELKLESEFRREDSTRNPKYRLERWTLPSLWTAQISHNEWAHDPDRYVLELEMPRDGSLAQYRQGMEWGLDRIRSYGGREAMTWGRDDSPRAEVQQSVGFGIVETIPVSYLELDQFSADQVTTRKQELEREGIRFCTIADLKSEGVDPLPLLYESTWEMSADIPAAYEPTKPTYEEFVERLTSSDQHDETLMFAAMDGPRLVGYSRLYASKADPMLYRTGMSGSVRSHRRRGIVTVLKVISAEIAKQRGARRIRTENNDVNPMYNLNVRLGFRASHNVLILGQSLDVGRP